ncbi:WD40-like Beta Propeller Repeat [Pricia antarctica]|uniref:WD40-like Beta Propeller Repeat n=1 Tax=Pricia antarctica TaxID=641691 RepID=A0A1G6X2R7_9FLAO|nr:OmpA family protein [Pricia antarctica]SDD72510.1 WD40-like Beta Propeller Repeat [Pricia antarctica]
MKKLLPLLILLLGSSLFAQDLNDLGIDESRTTASNDTNNPTLYADPVVSINKTFEEAADSQNIPYRTFSGLESVENGYYIISGVFGKRKNLNKMVKRLKRKGFAESGYITNPENGLNYVYLTYYPFGLEAVDACVSKLEDTYTDTIWILEIENSMTIGGSSLAMLEVSETGSITTAEIDEEEAETSNSAEQLISLDSHAPSISIAANKSKTIQKADAYFNKMWYAEAAELYEQALSKGEKYYTRDNIQKAADAHYYNTDMEKAYQWYNILYENYGKEMAEENMFRYAHSLKGAGKYGRAKRLMRLYNRKTENGKDEGLNNAKIAANEIVLDEILDSEDDYELKNMAINTQYSDFSPMFFDSSQIVFSSARDSSLFKTRKYKWNDQPYLDLYVAEINKASQDLQNAIKFSKKINTKYHEASVAFSPDNRTMYFTRNNYGKRLKRDKEGVNHLKIYKSNKIGSEWAEAVEVSFNSNDYSTGHPALSPDGKQLYFVSDMPGSIGKTDIFVVDVFDDGSFSTPRNLGPGINTEKREMFPFFNGTKLYFSSDGHTGLGGLDVFETPYDAEEGFGAVANLGKPINSNKDDFSYIVDEENYKGFFASNRAGGKGDDDIYSFKRPAIEEIPANHNAITGVITELVAGDLMPKVLVQLLDENGIKLKEMMTEDDGSFVFEDLEGNTKYTLKSVKGQFFDDERPVATVDNQRVNVDISMKHLKDMIAVEEGVKKLKTEMIYFEFDKSNVRSDAAKELDKLVSVMKEYPGMAIKIESHTDSRGSRAYNEYLSDMRAKSTRDYILSQGIDASRIESAIGYGESRLLNECDGTVRCSEATHLLNRRSEFIIVRE